MVANNNIEVFSTITWSAGAGCHGGCGQKLIIQDGKLIKVEGDEKSPWNQGRSCPRVLALKQYVYHPDRITKPLKRVGKRGEGKFEPITWDEAFDICETKLKNIRDQHGAESVIFAQGTGRDVGGPISFLAYNYGSPNWCQLGLSGQSCYTPRLGAMKATTGEFMVLDASQFSEKRYEDPEWEVPKVIVVWGQNPPPTCPDGFYGHWIV
ncbi:MAG: molybdopterin-dependent oxidoreductase, partial [Deltaproteobacteria bacterium]|nr:molybdopterin-dependent oxidoreductase [Deltaproteobacteria bacterium]